jgi:cytochrome c nitrite reductase small subunit
MKVRRAAIAGIVLSALFGVMVGVGFFTFGYAKGYSYLTNDPKACVNCHIMQEQYDAWIKSSHRNVATCNDCHTPPGLIAKYNTKAQNGFWHSFYFTTGTFPDPIRITPRNRNVTEKACRKCHGEIVDAIEGRNHSVQQMSCIRCHRSVGHMH